MPQFLKIICVIQIFIIILLPILTPSGLYSDVAYYNDRYGLEADIVLHLDDGRYALVECKLGSREIEEGATHLLELQRLIREHNLVEKQMPIREPDLLIVLTGGQYGYRRKDGIYIIPIGSLKD